MKKLFRADEGIEVTLFRLGWIFIILTSGILLASALSAEIRRIFFTPCYFNLLTGFYCPGCGGSRAVIYLIQGKPGKSLAAHPFLLYGGGLFTFFMVSQTLSRMTKGRISGLRYRNWYLYLGVAVVILNWIIKNAGILFFKIDLLNI